MAPISSTKPKLPQVILTCDQCSVWLHGIEGAAKPVVIAEARQRGWHVATVYLYEDGVRTNETIEKVLCPQHAKERAMCDHGPKHLVWKAQDGEVVICKMDDTHLVNALKFLVDRGQMDTESYSQMYAEKERRLVEAAHRGHALDVLAIEVPAPPSEAAQESPAELELVPDSKLPRVWFEHASPDGQRLARINYDLVKELAPGQHAVVSRKADKGMVINIDEDTVKALYTVLQRIGGNPKTTSRGLTLALLSAMVDTIPQSEWEIPWAVYIDNDLHGSVYWV